jgi:hypothetical protein
MVHVPDVVDQIADIPEGGGGGDTLRDVDGWSATVVPAVLIATESEQIVVRHPPGP